MSTHAMDINEEPQMVMVVLVLVGTYAVGGWPLLLWTVGAASVLLLLVVLDEKERRQ